MHTSESSPSFGKKKNNNVNKSYTRSSRRQGANLTGLSKSPKAEQEKVEENATLSPNPLADMLQSCSKICSRTQRMIMSYVKSSCYDLLEKQTSISEDKKPFAQKALEAEVQLWLECKTFRDTRDKSIIHYLNGFYVSLLHLIHITWSSEFRKSKVSCGINQGSSRLTSQEITFFSGGKPSLLSETLVMDLNSWFRSESSAKPSESTEVNFMRILVYNVTIRLGDLNRYLKINQLSEDYYCQARNLDPMRGHAYNQLALMSCDPLSQIYFYIRALCSMEEPMSIAAHNIHATVNGFISQQETPGEPFNPVVNNIITLFTATTSEDFPPSAPTIDPNFVDDWLYLAVIAIFNKRVSIILSPLIETGIILLKKFNESEKPTTQDDPLRVMPAIDIILDYCQIPTFRELALIPLANRVGMLKRLRIEIMSILGSSPISSCSPVSPSEVNGQSVVVAALSHDMSLVGFKHLKDIHSRIDFGMKLNKDGLQNDEMMILMSRMRGKIDSFFDLIQLPVTPHRVSTPPGSANANQPSSSRSKGSRRNVALQSILSGGHQ